MDWRSTGSLVTTFVLVRSIPRILPPEVYGPIRQLVSEILGALGVPALLGSLNPTTTFVFDQQDPSGFPSDLFDSIQAYLSSKSLAFARAVNLYRSRNSTHITYSLPPNESLTETFDGIRLTWSSHSISKRSLDVTGSSEYRSFHLRFLSKHYRRVHEEYLAHVLAEADSIRFRNRERKIYTNRMKNSPMLWSSTRFSHPSTFDTIAMDPALKEDIKTDLLKFLGRKEFFSRVGRAWKRGYLLYGPPGTGKTSLIAAIANFLMFDIYDLELSAVESNSQLRSLLLATTAKSVIVIEDIDCTVDLSNRGTKRHSNGTEVTQSVSLSGVLNFIDGLWSSLEGERLMIFTTNHKENLDAALLRPGRMDRHIHMGYCKLAAFKTLVKNYLGITDHELMTEVEELLASVEMTPADVAEVLMGCEDDPDRGMMNVVDAARKRHRIEINSEAGVENEDAEEVEELLASVQMTPADVQEVLMGCDGPDRGTMNVVDAARKRRRIEINSEGRVETEEVKEVGP